MNARERIYSPNSVRLVFFHSVLYSLVLIPMKMKDDAIAHEDDSLTTGEEG